MLPDYPVHRWWKRCSRSTEPSGIAVRTCVRVPSAKKSTLWNDAGVDQNFQKEFLEEGTRPLHPHTFSLTKNMPLFTKSEFRPYEGPPAACLQESPLPVYFTTELPFVRPLGVLGKDENLPFVKTPIFLVGLKVWGGSPFPSSKIWEPIIHMNFRGNPYGPIPWCLAFREHLYGPMAVKVRQKLPTRDWHWSMDGSFQHLSRNYYLTCFHEDFGKGFPSRTLWRGPPWNCPSPSSVLCHLLYRTEQVSRGEKGDKVPWKGEDEGWPAKGGKKEKGRVKTGQLGIWFVFDPWDVKITFRRQKLILPGHFAWINMAHHGINEVTEAPIL